MPRWRVEGAYEHSGADAMIELNARSPQQAERKARAKGLLVSGRPVRVKSRLLESGGRGWSALAIAVLCVLGVFLFYGLSASVPSAENEPPDETTSSLTNDVVSPDYSTSDSLSVQDETDRQLGDSEPVPVSSWQQLRQFSGTGPTKTDTFSVSDDRFRIKWSAWPARQSEGMFSASVERPNGFTAGLIANTGVDGRRRKTTHIYESPGTFYLDIGGYHAHWSVIVQVPDR